MKIKNETLNKLTLREAQDLGLMNHGIMFYKGKLKKYTKAYQAGLRTDKLVTYINRNNASQVIEFVKLADEEDKDGWAFWGMRIFDTKTTSYDEHFNQPLAGLEFISI